MQSGDHAVDLLFTDQIFLEQFDQEVVMRQLSHLDGVLNGFPPWFERKTGSSFVDGNSVEINFRTEPPVQFNFALAKVVAFFQRAEIQKPEIHRFLDRKSTRLNSSHVSISYAV